MVTEISMLVRTLTGQEGGLHCRSCNDRISTRDAFGSSEGICCVCRSAADA